jgi:hypothetical protein
LVGAFVCGLIKIIERKEMSYDKYGVNTRNSFNTKPKEAVMEQNINIRNKINEANHNYQDMRLKAKRRIRNRASLYEIASRRQEMEIQKSLGVDSFMGIKKEKLVDILLGLIYLAFATFLYVWVTL